jgi:hypothetical protein
VLDLGKAAQPRSARGYLTPAHRYFSGSSAVASRNSLLRFLATGVASGSPLCVKTGVAVDAAKNHC